MISEMSPNDPFVNAVRKLHTALTNKGASLSFENVFHALSPGPTTQETQNTDRIMKEVLGVSIHDHNWEHELLTLGLSKDEVIALSNDYDDYDIAS